jgi:hypothetical protein
MYLNENSYPVSLISVELSTVFNFEMPAYQIVRQFFLQEHNRSDGYRSPK